MISQLRYKLDTIYMKTGSVQYILSRYTHSSKPHNLVIYHYFATDHFTHLVVVEVKQFTF